MYSHPKGKKTRHSSINNQSKQSGNKVEDGRHLCSVVISFIPNRFHQNRNVTFDWYSATAAFYFSPTEKNYSIHISVHTCIFLELVQQTIKQVCQKR